ncbi:MAG: nucleotidyltransferase domain-containing protein [Acidobacteriota bacterium]|nr:nucleotidyltransferase domain-containing protein [Acidobacteriota bacterium]
MTADQYLQGILAREAVFTGLASPLWGVQGILMPTIREWANRFLLEVHASGSFMKGTANKSGTDIDLFISLSEETAETLKEVHNTLCTKLTEKGYTPRRQNVSIGISVNGYSVDLVPAKRQNAFAADHSLYRRKADTWTKTNVVTHINTVINCGRQAEIRTLKLWRNQKSLDFPSFYLELTAIAALPPGTYGTLSQNVRTVLQYLRDNFPNARVVDPANTNNIISDDLTATDKAKVKAAAVAALTVSDWNEIVR